MQGARNRCSNMASPLQSDTDELFHGYVHTDGSLRRRGRRDDNRGGWACIMVDKKGNILHGMCGPTRVPAAPRTYKRLLAHRIIDVPTILWCGRLGLRRCGQASAIAASLLAYSLRTGSPTQAGGVV